MHILFVSCYVNNAHYIHITKKTLDKYLINTTYNFVCLNDAPNIKEGEKSILPICDIITGNENCYELIENEANKNNFIHIKIPQHIHYNEINRINHSSARHIENLNWFNQNFQNLIPNYNNYDFICHIDSDAFLRKTIDLTKELEGYDMAGPFIYLNPNLYYIHTGLFFINLKTIKNIKDIKWDNTLQTDTGSDIANFIKNNPQYKIKKLGHYDGYSSNLNIVNNHTIISLNIVDIEDDTYKNIDIWFNSHFYHFRAGSCFGVGSLLHRNNDRLYYYNKKMEAFMKLFNDLE